MRYFDLLEKRLPLSDLAYRNNRSEKATFVAVIDPIEFIRLTVPSEDAIQRIIDNTKVELPQYDRNDYFMPYLYVNESGKIIGHEGRHRAAMIHKAGGDRFPITIHMHSNPRYLVTYRGDNDEGEEVSGSEEFPTYEEAEAFEERLKNDPHFYYRSDIDSIGNKKLGRKSDMPSYLIGQFNDHRYPTSLLKFGRAK